MDIKAAVLDAMGAESPYAASKPLTIETLQLDAPGPGEILVRIEAAGLCHSDLSVINGNRPRPMPMALGHEAAGIVEEVGPAVGGAGGADLRPGDHVVFVFVPSCGHCEPCDELQATGATRADRGRLLDETLDVFDAVWGPDPVTFRGPRVVIDNASVLPKPVSKIPVMLGGGGSNLGRSTSSKALQRIAQRADGWLPVLTTPGPAGAAELRAGWDRIREMASGRPGYGRCPNGRRGWRRRAHRGSKSAGLVHQHSADA